MISKTGTQVINAFVEPAKLPEGKFEGTNNIAKRIKARRNYLGKMLQSFSNTGLVVSQKGFGGGFRLGKDSKGITLYDIIEPMDHIALWSECALGLKKCEDTAPCHIYHQWKNVRETYYNFLKNLNMADLAAENKKINGK